MQEEYYGPTLSLDIIFDILDLLDLSAYELAPYRRCCRAMYEMMSRLVKRLDTSNLPEFRAMNNNWVETIGRMYPNLQVLQISGIDVTDDEAILFARLPKLKSVDMYECDGIGDATISALVAQCSHIESLALGGSLRRHGAKITNLSIQALVNHASSLQDLHLTSCYLLTDDAIVALAEKRGSQLRSISLSRCAKITDNCIETLAMHSPNLQSVGVNECFRLTSAAVIALASCCPNLVSVNMRGTRVTDNAIEALAMKCPLLEAVNLECCLQLTDAGVMTLGTRAMTRSGISGWNENNINQSNYTRYNEVATTNGLYTMSDQSQAPERTASPFEQQRHSDLSDGARRSDESGMDEFDEFAVRLRTLSVSGCVRLTDASIVSVAQSCHNLATVDLSQVYDLTDASVVALASNCGPHLTSLKLSRCGRITDYAIAAVGSCCRGLRAVSMDDCYGLTDAAIQVLATKCSLLEAVDISHCAKLTDQSVFALTAHCKRLVRLDMRFPQTSLGGPSLLTPRAVIALATVAAQPRSSLRFVDLSGHPRLLTPEAAAAIALAEQPPHYHAANSFHIGVNSGGGGGGGGSLGGSFDDMGEVPERQTNHPRVVFLVDKIEVQTQDEQAEENVYFSRNHFPPRSDPLNDFSSFSNSLPDSNDTSSFPSPSHQTSAYSNSGLCSSGSSAVITEAAPVDMYNQHSLWNNRSEGQETEKKSVVRFDLPSDGEHGQETSVGQSMASRRRGSVGGRARQFLRSTFNLLGGSVGDQEGGQENTGAADAADDEAFSSGSAPRRLSRKSSGGSSSSLKKKRKSNK